MNSFVKEALDNYGRIDVLINNAGIHMSKKLIDTSEGIDLNLTSRIQELIGKYSIFENILPEELLETDFTKLKSAKDDAKIIMNEDLESI